MLFFLESIIKFNKNVVNICINRGVNKNTFFPVMDKKQSCEYTKQRFFPSIQLELDAIASFWTNVIMINLTMFLVFV